MGFDVVVVLRQASVHVLARLHDIGKAVVHGNPWTRHPTNRQSKYSLFAHPKVEVFSQPFLSVATTALCLSSNLLHAPNDEPPANTIFQAQSESNPRRGTSCHKVFSSCG